MTRTSPRLNHRRRRRTAVAVGLAALVLVGVTAATTPAAADTRVLVGMGDSYSTGGWIPPADPSAGLCNRSLNSYPFVAADELGFTGRSVACGGAVLADFTHPSRRGAQPQTADIADADIVAFTMGGNDVGGPGGVLDSGASPATVANFTASVDALSPRLVTAYGDVQRSAPEAQMYVLGYPDIAPRTQQALDSCLGARAAGLDAGFIHDNIAHLNRTIAAAAATAGATFVDTTASFAGHQMCTGTPYANAPGEFAPASPGGGMHPNELGHLAMAADLLAAIGAPDQPPPTPGPPIPGPPIPGPPVAVPPVPGPPIPGPLPTPGPPVAVPPVPGPPVRVQELTPQERATARAAAAALQQRIQGDEVHRFRDRIPW